MSATPSRKARYRGREYILKYLGDTKYGRRACLQFIDREHEFWVPANDVIELELEELEGPDKTQQSGKPDICPTCGRAYDAHPSDDNDFF